MPTTEEAFNVARMIASTENPSPPFIAGNTQGLSSKQPSFLTALLSPHLWSAADVKMEIPVLVLKSSILSSTSFQMGKTFW